MGSPRPVDRARARAGSSDERVGRALQMALVLALVMVVGFGSALVWRAFTREEPQVSGGGLRSPASPATPTDLYATIPGTKTTDLTAWWSARWRVAFPYDGRNSFTATVPAPIPDGQLTIAAVRPMEDALGWPRLVRCALRGANVVVDQPMLKLLADGCMAPVLQDRERTDVPDWLYARVVGLPAGEQREETFPRFTVLVEHRSATELTISLAAR